MPRRHPTLYSKKSLVALPLGLIATPSATDHTRVQLSWAPYPALVAKDGAIAYWRLSETSGLLTSDSRGTQHGYVKGTVLLNQPSAITGVSDPSMQFSGGPNGDATYGGGSVPIVTSSAAFNALSQVTVEAWIFPTARDFGAILEKAIGGGDTNTGFLLFLEGRWVWRVVPVGGGFTQVEYPITLNQWQHIAATCDGANLRLFINAVEVVTPVAIAGMQQGAGSVLVGHLLTAPYALNGVLDEVAVYPTALSQATLASHLAARTTPLPSNRVHVYRDGGLIADVAAGASGYLDTGLAANTSYAYVIRNVVGVSESASSPTAVATTFIGPPANLVVSQVAALPSGLLQLRLTWENTRPDLQTEIWHSNGDWSGVSPAPGVTTAVVSGLAPNTAYSFYMTHSGPQGIPRSGRSNTASATTQTLAAPTNFLVSQIAALPQGATQLQLTWTPAHPSYSTEIWDEGLTQWMGNAGPGVGSFTVTGLPSSYSRGYYARHFVSGYGYVSAFSNHSWSTTQPAFGAPTLNSVTVNSATSLTLQWTNFNGGDYINIYRNGVFLEWRNPGVTSYVDTGLAVGTTYSYMVEHTRNTDQWYYSGGSNAVAATTTVPAPTAVSVTPTAFPGGISQLQIVWQNYPDPNLYTNIYHYDGANYQFAAQLSPGVTSWTQTGLGASELHHFAFLHNHVNGQVSALTYAGGGTTLAHLPAPVWVNLYPPAPPSGMSQLVLQWQDPGAIHYTHIGVERDGVIIAWLGAPTTAWTDTGLNYNQTYTYRLVFHDSPTGYVSPYYSNGAARATYDHLRMTYVYGTSGTVDLTANPTHSNVTPGLYQVQFNRGADMNWFGCAGGGGGGGGYGDYYGNGQGGGGAGGGSGASHIDGTQRGVVAGYLYQFMIGGGGGGGAGNSYSTTRTAGGAGGYSACWVHDGSAWTIFMHLNPGGGGAAGSDGSYRASPGAGGDLPLSIGVAGGSGGYGGYGRGPHSETNGTPGIWGGRNSGGGGGGCGFNYESSIFGSGGYAENGGAGGAGGMVSGSYGQSSGGQGGAPAVGGAGTEDPCGGGGGGGAGVWGPYGGGGGGGGGSPLGNGADQGSGAGGAGAGGFMVIQSRE